jgi:RNA polymerase sigma-70 factor (ECF subfamily)
VVDSRSDSVGADVAAAVEQAHRAEWGLVLASVARLLDGDLATAEECTQEAYVAALETWGERGVPARPGAWLTTTARRRALDRVRRESGMRERFPDLVRADDERAHAAVTEEEDAVVVDDRLRLVFTCCHPSLAAESRVALTLRMVCGLSTPEIARAFLVPEPTMAARITRAKKKITAAGVPYRVPYGAELPDRLDGVLTVIHLVFTTGYTAEGPSLVRADLVERALDLARVLAVLMPDEPEALGLLALLELTDARRAARTDPAGRLVLLEDQDRSRWDRALVEHGTGLLDRALRLTRPGHPAGRFTLQAAIAAAHAESPTWQDTDWLVILALYDRLLEAWPTAVVAVNRAVALSFVSGPEAGLVELDRLAAEPALRGYHYLPAARADLLRRSGRHDEASAAYAEALALAPPGQEHAFLAGRLAELTDPSMRDQDGL